MKEKKTSNSEPHKEPTVRTTEGLRDRLFDVLDDLSSGNITGQEAIAVCKVCSQIINSVNTEIEAWKHIFRHREGQDIPRLSIQLGRPKVE